MNDADAPEVEQLHDDAPVLVAQAGPIRVEDNPPVSLTATSIPVPTESALMAASERPARAFLTIRAEGGPVYISGNPGMTVGSGYLIPDGQAERIEATAAVYVITDTANVTAYVLSQHRDG